MRVLVVESHRRLALLVGRALQAQAVIADIAHTGEDALRMSARHYDVIVLGVALSGIDGLETCRRLRATGVAAPVLLLGPRGPVEQRVAGLDAGADDYVTKPVHVDELLARLRALARRAPRTRAPALRVGDLVFDEASCQVRRAGHEVSLTHRERQLLAVLMRHAGRVVSRERLIEDVWDGVARGESNIIDVYVRYLRNKIDRPFGRRSLETVRGTGYRLNAA